MLNFQINNISDQFGVEVIGLDVSKNLNEKDYEMIRAHEDSQKKPKMATPEQNAEFNRQLKDALLSHGNEEA